MPTEDMVPRSPPARAPSQKGEIESSISATAVSPPPSLATVRDRLAPPPNRLLARRLIGRSVSIVAASPPRWLVDAPCREETRSRCPVDGSPRDLSCRLCDSKAAICRRQQNQRGVPG